MRSVVVAGLVVLFGVQSARASFELMYIPSVNDDKIYRYDPINRILLGSINAQGASAVFYTGGSTGLVTQVGLGNNRYDMINGINESFINSTQFSSISEDGTTVSNLNLTSAVSMATGGGSVGSTTLATTLTMFSGTRLSNGSMVGFGSDGTNLRVALFNSSGAQLTSSTLINGTTHAAHSNVIITQSVTGNVWVRCIVRDTTGQQLRMSVQMSPLLNSFVTALSTSLGTFTWNSTSALSMAVSHSGYYIVGSDASSPTTTTRFASFNNNGVGTQNGGWTEQFDTRNTSGFMATSNVLAPEPGTWAAMGLGIAGLMAIRRRR